MSKIYPSPDKLKKQTTILSANKKLFTRNKVISEIFSFCNLSNIVHCYKKNNLIHCGVCIEDNILNIKSVKDFSMDKVYPS